MSTQDTILSALAELVLERPYASFSVNDVNAHAGVSKTQFYHHFSSKDVAAAEFVRIENRKSWDHLRRQIDCRTSSLETLTAATFELTDYLLTTPRFRAALIVQNEIGRDVSLDLQLFDVWRTHVAETIASAVSAGDVRADVDPENMATQLVASWNGLRILHETLDPTSSFLDRVADMLELHVTTALHAGRREYLGMFISRYLDRTRRPHLEYAAGDLRP